MLRLDIPEGALFYGKNRRRQVVSFDEALRELTGETSRRLHALIDAGVTPPAEYEKKCGSCSLQDLCVPRAATGKRSVEKYLREVQR